MAVHTDKLPVSAAYLAEKTEEERLLGVSMTGIMDNAILNGRSAEYGNEYRGDTGRLRQVAVDTNAKVAKKIGLIASTAITCVKPSVRFHSLLILRQVSMHVTANTTFVLYAATKKTRSHSS